MIAYTISHGRAGWGLLAMAVLLTGCTQRFDVEEERLREAELTARSLMAAWERADRELIEEHNPVDDGLRVEGEIKPNRDADQGQGDVQERRSVGIGIFRRPCC